MKVMHSTTHIYLPMWGPWSLLHIDTANTWRIVEQDCHIDRILLVTIYTSQEWTAPILGVKSDVLALSRAVFSKILSHHFTDLMPKIGPFIFPRLASVVIRQSYHAKT